MLRARTWRPPPPIDRHVAAVWRLAGDGGLDDWLLPDVAGAELAIELGEPVAIALGDGALRARRLVVGGLDRARPLRQAATVDTVGIRLVPGCACLLGAPAAAVRDVIAPLDVVAPALDAALAAWADAVRDRRAGVDALWAVLGAHLPTRCDPLAVRAARRLAATDAPPVAALADELGVSRRQLARRFQAAVGVTPREFVRRARFRRAWEAAAAAPASWASIAAAAGYADQPHLDRDFRLLVGLPPTRVFTPDWYRALGMSPRSKP